MQRREWMKNAGLASIAGLGLSAGQFTEAREIASRNSSSHMKLSLAAYSFTRMLPFNWPKPRKSNATMTLLDFIDFCAEMNLDGCELTSYYFPTEVTPEYLAELKLKTFLLGLDISGTAIGNDFCHPEGSDRDNQLALTRLWIDYAATMGAPVIRIFAGRQKKDQSFEEAVELCSAGINESLEYAAGKGVCLALENHGGITATPKQLLQIIDKIKPSPNFGVNFDSGNFRTDDPYGDLEQIAPLAINAQIKVEMFEGKQKVSADMKRIVKILKKANYRGYIVLEYEAKEDPKAAIPEHLKRLRDLIA
ncbi:MAG: sugar phosphate isomerase/epimerase [Planctomycetaceae bacterium]|nr:sugar phosphate isomerase/epimerase [Planctomycetaceae bacterium]